MQAAVLYGPNDLRLEELEVPSFGPDEMLVKVVCAAICGTDLRIISGGKTRGIHYPSVIGHEISGIVEECGAEVTHFKPGDRVGFMAIVPCGLCPDCLAGRGHVCPHHAALGYKYAGGYQQYMHVPADAMAMGCPIKLPASVSLEEAALLEPLACCYNGNRRSQIGPGVVVAIVGAGPVGVMHLLLAKLAGAAQVIMSEISPTRRDNAIAMGADAVVGGDMEDLREEVLKRSDGCGADSIIMAAGVPEIVDDLQKMVRTGGVLNLFAGFSGSPTPPIDVNAIHYGEIIVTGTSGSNAFHTLEALKLMKSRQIDLTPLISHQLPLSEIHHGLEIVERREGMRVVIRPNG